MKDNVGGKYVAKLPIEFQQFKTVRLLIEIELPNEYI